MKVNQSGGRQEGKKLLVLCPGVAWKGQGWRRWRAHTVLWLPANPLISPKVVAKMSTEGAQGPDLILHIQFFL